MNEITLPCADEAAAHMYPWDIEKFQSGEHTATAFSIAVGCPDGESVPLFTLEQVRAAIALDRKQRFLKERAQLEQEWATIKGMQAQYEAVRQGRGEPVAWMLSKRVHNSDPKFCVADPTGVYASEYIPLRSPQPAEPVSLHPDDAAVDAFAAEMKAKLAKKRADGRAGWQECTSEYLSGLLREHVEKGDPLDVANLAMMLHQTGQRIVPTKPVKVPSVLSAIIQASQFAPGESFEDVEARVSALLSRYGSAQPAIPSNSGELAQPAASAGLQNGQQNIHENVHSLPDGWKGPAAQWLRAKAEEQQATNEQFPKHAECYPSWEMWVHKLTWLADELSAPTPPADRQAHPEPRSVNELLVTPEEEEAWRQAETRQRQIDEIFEEAKK